MDDSKNIPQDSTDKMSNIPPTVEVISANTLSNTIATLSSGGDSSDGGSSTPVYNEVDIVFSGIKVFGKLSPVDHAALIIKKSDGYGYFYSFGGDTDEWLAAVTKGTPGYLSTAVSESGYVAQDEAKESQLIQISKLTSNGSVLADKIKERNGAENTGYYRMIKIPINNSTGVLLVQYANRFREGCVKLLNGESIDDNSICQEISPTYNFLFNNCYDVASQLLGLLGYEIVYDKSHALDMLTALAEFAADYFPEGTMPLLVQAMGLGFPNDFSSIPNDVFDYFREVRKNGVVVSGVTKSQFLTRS